MVINSLRSEDEQVFKRMENNYISLSEKIFFEMLQYKMKYELAPSNDLLMSETDNSDLIYIVRVDYDEFIVGHGEVAIMTKNFML